MGGDEWTRGAAELPGLEDFVLVGARVAAEVPQTAWSQARGDPEERERLARMMHAAVREAWGLPLSDALEFQDLGPTLRGAFSLTDGSLRIAEWLLDRDDPSDVLQTLAHENRHDMQRLMLAGRLSHPGGVAGQRELDLWKRGLAEYRPGEVEGYVYNPVETDARAAASGVVTGYWRATAECLAQASESDEEE